MFSPPRPNIHTDCDTISSNSCSFEPLDSDSESSPLSASVPQHLPSCALMQTLQIAAPVVHSTPRATGKENVTPISAQSRLSFSLPLAPDKLETPQVEMIFVCFGSARSECRVPSPRVHVDSANRPWHEEQTSRRASAHCTELASHTPSIAFRHLPPRKDVVNQCLEFAGQPQSTVLPTDTPLSGARWSDA